MTPPFLQWLELDATADERAIRRAYAQKLKKIDPQADPAGFQALRAAYDAALNWVRHAAGAAPEPGAVHDAPSAARAPTVESAHSYAAPQVAPRVRVREAARTETPPVQSARARPLHAGASPEDYARACGDRAFNVFLDTFRAELNAARSALDRQAWRAKLEHALADDELVNMAARDGFEHRFALLLTQGWKPGHEVLFVIAAGAFRWDEDRGSLRRLGQAGVILERAMQERALFDLQPQHERVTQREVIQRWRDPAEPSPKHLGRFFATWESLARNFPTWLGMITDLSRFPRWREIYSALPENMRVAPKPVRRGMVAAKPRTSTSKAPKTGVSWGWSWSLILLIGALFRLVPHPGDNTGQNYRAAPTTRIEQPSEHGASPPVNVASLQRMLTAPNNAVPPAMQRDTPAPAPPPSKAAIAAIVRKPPSLELCSEIYRMTEVYDVGMRTQKVNFGAAFDRQIIACVAKRYWPVAAYNAPAVEQALERERTRPLIDAKKMQAVLAGPKFAMPKPVAPLFTMPAAN